MVNNMSDMNTRNRLGNVKNPYQGDSKRVLTVCSAGLLRSPTAAWVLSNAPWNFNTRSCGYSEEYALVVLNQVLLHWADFVVVMDNKQEKYVSDMMLEYGYNKPVYNLNVPDSFDYRNPELVDLLTEKFTELFPAS
jgi:predicted protein tyrosine phosphatase